MYFCLIQLICVYNSLIFNSLTMIWSFAYERRDIAQCSLFFNLLKSTFVPKKFTFVYFFISYIFTIRFLKCFHLQMDIRECCHGVTINKIFLLSGHGIATQRKSFEDGRLLFFRALTTNLSLENPPRSQCFKLTN